MRKMINGVYYDLTQDELADYQNRLDEYKANLPSRAMEELREQRNRLLGKTDWEMTKALETGSDATALKEYRQALRDLPANSTPSLNEGGNLTGVEWPTKPTE